MNDQTRSFSNLEEALNTTVLKKDSKEDVTLTQYSQFRTRTFHIPPELYTNFMQLYYHDIIKSKKTHNLIERQLIHKNSGPGPLLVDIDLQFSAECVDRQYQDSHIEDKNKKQITWGAVEKVIDGKPYALRLDENKKPTNMLYDINTFLMAQKNPKIEVQYIGRLVEENGKTYIDGNL